MKKFLKHLWIAIKRNGNWKIHHNFLSVKNWAALITLAGLYAIKYVLFTGTIDASFDGVILLDWILAPSTIFVLLFAQSRKNLTTYLIFLILAKGISIGFGILGHDLGSAKDAASVPDSWDTVTQTLKTIGHITVAGTVVVEVLILPLMFVTLVGSVADLAVAESIESKAKKVAWWLTLTVMEIATFWAVFQYLIYPYYDTLSQTLINKQAANGTGNIYSLIKPLLAFAWFPLLFIINNMRRTNLFNGRNMQIYYGTQITFLIKYIGLLTTYNSVGMYIPPILVGFIGLKLLVFAVAVIKTVTGNAKHSDEKGFVFYNISLFKQPNEMHILFKKKDLKSVQNKKE